MPSVRCPSHCTLAVAPKFWPLARRIHRKTAPPPGPARSPKKSLAISKLVKYNPPNGSTQFTHPGPGGRWHHGGAARRRRRYGWRAGRPARPDLRLPPAHHGAARTPHHPLAVRPAAPHPPSRHPAGVPKPVRRHPVFPPFRHAANPPTQARASTLARGAAMPTTQLRIQRARPAPLLPPSPGRLPRRHRRCRPPNRLPRCRTPPNRPPDDFRPRRLSRRRTLKMLRYQYYYAVS